MAVERLSQASIGTLNKYSSMMAGSAYLTDFQLISTQLIASNTASVTFSSIDQTYRHLQIRITARTDRALQIDGVKLRFNSDAGTNYSAHYLLGEGTTVSSSATTSGTAISGIAVAAGATAAANIYGVGIADILDYGSSTKFKTLRSLLGGHTVTFNYVQFSSGAWLNTAAVTAITLLPSTGPNFVAGSRISLYGWN